jgi:hypothetical protein
VIKRLREKEITREREKGGKEIKQKEMKQKENK